MSAHQLTLLAAPPAPNRVINVASVPQLSPFRYPGGKTWLIPYIRQWLQHQPGLPARLIEPFSGGAIVGLTAACEGLAEQVTLVELDDQVAAVWHIILSDQAEAFAERIARFPFTAANVQHVLSQPAETLLDKAFQTLLKNRINRGGILAPGAGKVKQGEAGKGLESRWYPQTLKRRVLAIAAQRHRLTFCQADGLAVLQAHRAEPTTVFFIDPPYTAGGKRAGSRLYTHFDVDHAALFALAAQCAGDFLMTYDDAPEVRALAHEHGLAVQAIPMKNTHHRQVMELLVGRDLSWLR